VTASPWLLLRRRVRGTLPSDKPIKPIYVMRFVALIDSLGSENGD
jgi:hypothetical protein